MNAMNAGAALSELTRLDFEPAVSREPGGEACDFRDPNSGWKCARPASWQMIYASSCAHDGEAIPACAPCKAALCAEIALRGLGQFYCVTCGPHTKILDVRWERLP